MIFDIKGSSKTFKFMPFSEENFTAAKVTEANFKTTACLFTFHRRKYFFAYGRRSNIHCIIYTNMNIFVCSVTPINSSIINNDKIILD